MDIEKVRLELASVRETLRDKAARVRLRAKVKSCLRSGFWSIVALHAFGAIASAHVPYVLVAVASAIVAVTATVPAIRNWRMLRVVAANVKPEDEPKPIDVFDSYMERVDDRLSDDTETATDRFQRATEAYERANRAEWAHRYAYGVDGAISQRDPEWNRLRDITRRATDDLREATDCLRGAYTTRTDSLHRHAYFAAKELGLDFGKNV